MLNNVASWDHGQIVPSISGDDSNQIFMSSMRFPDSGFTGPFSNQRLCDPLSAALEATLCRQLFILFAMDMLGSVPLCTRLTGLLLGCNREAEAVVGL
jgi:hypothetical protein